MRKRYFKLWLYFAMFFLNFNCDFTERDKEKQTYPIQACYP